MKGTMTVSEDVDDAHTDQDQVMGKMMSIKLPYQPGRRRMNPGLAHTGILADVTVQKMFDCRPEVWRFEV